MVQEAEQFADEDKAIKERIDAKHALQNYVFTMRNTIEDSDKLADKLDADDKETIADAISEAEDWLNANDEATREDYDEQLKDLQKICDPIIATVYQSQGG